MNEKEFRFWLKRYNDHQNQEYAKNEHELSKTIRKQGYLTKEQFKKILDWKFGDFPARLKREKNLANQMNEESIKEITRTALESKDDLSRIMILYKLKGVKNAVASTILSFYDPKKNAVFDIHAWRELFGKEPKGFSSKPELLIEFLGVVRKLAEKHQVSARDVEKALFQKNYEDRI